MRFDPSRRDCFALAGGAAIAAAAAGVVRGAPTSTAAEGAASPTGAGTGARKRTLRLAHLTDIHVMPESGAPDGLTACLRHVQSQPDKPEMILNTGDCIMDATRKSAYRTDKQWATWRSVWKNECSLPAAHVLGNHDVWGWDKEKSGTNGGEPKWGKGWAMDELGMSRLYHSFDRGGWHVVGLDTVHPLDGAAPDVFTARLDDEQFAWLEADLAASGGKPTLVMSHIPIFSMMPVFNQKPDLGPREHMVIDRSDMLTDYHRIKELFKKHKNVKACLAGHIHLVDRVDYLGVSYMCGGAVSGAWWKGSRFNECEPGYSLIDLYDDGSVERQYVAYGFVPVQPQTKPGGNHPDGANTTKGRPAATHPDGANTTKAQPAPAGASTPEAKPPAAQ